MFLSDLHAETVARWDFRDWNPSSGFPIPANGGTQANTARLDSTFHPESVGKVGKEALRLNRGIAGNPTKNEGAGLELIFKLPEAGPLYVVYKIHRSGSGFSHQAWSFSSKSGTRTELPALPSGEIPAQASLCKVDISPLFEAGSGGEAKLRVFFSGGTGGVASNVSIEFIEICTAPEERSEARSAPESAPREAGAAPVGIRGIGGVYFLAEPGELVVEVEKRNGGGKMRAILTSPDREVVDAFELADGASSRSDPSLWVGKTVKTKVALAGVYRLEVFSSEDREGKNMVWGFTTNSAHYMIDSSASQGRIGSELPVVLDNPGQPAAFAFRAPSDQFEVAVSGLPESVKSVALETPRQQEALPVSKGEVKQQVALSPEERGLLVLRWPSQKGKIAIEGLTHWVGPRDSFYPRLPLWTNDPKSFFAVDYYRWTLLPYRTTRHTSPGGEGSQTFTVRNGSPQAGLFGLSLQGEDLAKWSARLDKESLQLGPGETAEVHLSYRAPTDATGKEWLCHLAVEAPVADPLYKTYSSLRVSLSPRDRNARAPIVLRPYEHENALYGYLPDYPLNEVAFDLRNRPMVRDRGADADRSLGIFRWLDKAWKLQPFSECRNLAGKTSVDAAARFPTKIAFDKENQAYTLLTCRDPGAKRVETYLIQLPGSDAMTAYPIEGGADEAFEMEQFTGHNQASGPPALLGFRLLTQGRTSEWKTAFRMELIVPEKDANGISFARRALVSERAIGVAMHSGGASQMVSDGDRVHVAWGEASPEGSHDPGVPTYVATYDRSTGNFGPKTLVGYGPPVNDVHNSPGIVMDGEGFLHVVTGAHGHPFQYARSRRPHSTTGGWSDPVDVTGRGGHNGGDTYVGLVCGPDDALHLVYRQNRYGDKDHFDGEEYKCLSYQRKRKDQPWEEPRILVVPPLPNYSVFYHRLSLDRKGNLFLSYSYRSAYRTYRADQPGFIAFPALLTSGDSGETWKLASNDDLAGHPLAHNQ